MIAICPISKGQCNVKKNMGWVGYFNLDVNCFHLAGFAMDYFSVLCVVDDADVLLLERAGNECRLDISRIFHASCCFEYFCI